MNDEWICKEMGREFSLLFWSASQLPPFILNFIKKFSTLLRLAEKVVVQLRRGEKGKAQQDDDNAVSLSSLPPPQPPSLSLSTLKLIPLQYSSSLSHQEPEN